MASKSLSILSKIKNGDMSFCDLPVAEGEDLTQFSVAIFDTRVKEDTNCPICIVRQIPLSEIITGGSGDTDSYVNSIEGEINEDGQLVITLGYSDGKTDIQTTPIVLPAGVTDTNTFIQDVEELLVTDPVTGVSTYQLTFKYNDPTISDHVVNIPLSQAANDSYVNSVTNEIIGGQLVTTLGYSDGKTAITSTPLTLPTGSGGDGNTFINAINGAMNATNDGYDLTLSYNDSTPDLTHTIPLPTSSTDTNTYATGIELTLDVSGDLVATVTMSDGTNFSSAPLTLPTGSGGDGNTFVVSGVINTAGDLLVLTRNDGVEIEIDISALTQTITVTFLISTDTPNDTQSTAIPTKGWGTGRDAVMMQPDQWLEMVDSNNVTVLVPAYFKKP